MNISQDCVVTIHYTLTNESGDFLDTSTGGDPLTYLHGYGGIIPGLEKALENKQAGESFAVILPPEEGYGLSDSELIYEVPLDALTQVANLTVGMELQSTDDQGRDLTLVVDTLSESHATLNANHPMAGKSLHFDIVVEGVRLATAAELETGRVAS